MTETIRHVAGILCLAIVLGVVVVEWAHAHAMVIFMKVENREVHSRRGTGVLVGYVTRGPLSPVDVPGVSRPPAPVSGTRVVIFALDGREIKSVGTNEHGEYSVRLPSGTYRIDMAPLAEGGFTKDLPATVTITAGQETRLDIRIDTGIR